MVVAGGNWQVDLVRKLKSMGCWVLCTNLYSDSPAFKYADASEVADVKDKKKNLEFAIKYNIEAVLSDQSDIAIPTVAYIAEKMNLPGIGIKRADICTDKSVMRDFCNKEGFLIPDYKPCSSIADAEAMLNKHGKIIIKPIDSQSARGVFIIKNREELEKNYPITVSYANRRKEILAEEYIGGVEFTIDGLIIKGNHYPLCISYKNMHEKNTMVSMRQTYTYKSDVFDYDELRRQNKMLAERIGLPFGLTHTEYRFDKGKFYLLEIAARGGGSNLSSKIVPYMSDIDNYEYLIKQALGEDVDDNKLKNHVFNDRKNVIMQFFDLGSGIVKKMHGLERLENSEFMLDYNMPVKEGDNLEEPKFGSMRPGHFSIAGEDLKQLEIERDVLLREVYAEF